MKKTIVICITLILLSAVMTTASARENKTLEERVAYLEACLKNVCGAPGIPVLSLPEELQNSPDVTKVVTTPEPTTTAEPTKEPTTVPTTEPTATMEPTAEPTAEPTIEPTAEPTEEPEEKQRCNQGRGNGGENCSPGKSDHNQPPNDEEPCNRGGQCVPQRD